MFKFVLEPEISLLTVIRQGFWSLSTVANYESALRGELASLRRCGLPTSFIIDIRSSGAQARPVADALRAMVERLGMLHAERTAVVTASGIAKLQAKRVADSNAQVFTSMVLARDWVMRKGEPRSAGNVIYDAPSDAEAEGQTVHIHGPSDNAVTLTPEAALETAKRIEDAAEDAFRQR